MVVSGAGASAIACTNFWVRLGVKRENVLMVDTKGVLHAGRTDAINQWKKPYVRETAAARWPTRSKGPTSSSAPR